MRLIYILICLTVSATAMAQTSRTGDPRPVNRMAKEVLEHLNAHDFDFLEKLILDLRKNSRVLPDGEPELLGYYAGVSRCIQMSCGDQILSPETWARHGALLDEWIRRFPNSSAAKLAKATYLKEYAWYARGTEYSDTVSSHQWKVFEERTQQARTLFEAVKAEASGDPAWYAGMLGIALVQGWPPDEFNALYDEGIGKFPYYLPLYFQKAAYVSPKWGGSIGRFTEYVDEVVIATSAQMGETMYARLNWSSWTKTMFETGQSDWSRMKSGFIRIIQDYPDPWNINNFAYFACIARDARTLWELLPKVGPNPIVEAWGNMEFYQTCKAVAQTQALTGAVVLIGGEGTQAFELMDLLANAGAEAVGPIPTVADLLAYARFPALRCAVLDVSLRREPVFPAAKVLKERGIGIVFYTSSADLPGLAREWPDAQIVAKPASQEHLLNAIRTTCRALGTAN